MIADKEHTFVWQIFQVSGAGDAIFELEVEPKLGYNTKYKDDQSLDKVRIAERISELYAHWQKNSTGKATFLFQLPITLDESTGAGFQGVGREKKL
jgi:hypothetical protein